MSRPTSAYQQYSHDFEAALFADGIYTTNNCASIPKQAHNWNEFDADSDYFSKIIGRFEDTGSSFLNTVNYRISMLQPLANGRIPNVHLRFSALVALLKYLVK